MQRQFGPKLAFFKIIWSKTLVKFLSKPKSESDFVIYASFYTYVVLFDIQMRAEAIWTKIVIFLSSLVENTVKFWS